MSLSEDQVAQYKPIIDGLLKASNLEEVSAKKILNSLQGAVGQDLTEHKKAIKTLIYERFDAAQAAQTVETNGKAASDSPKSEASPKSESPAENGVSSASASTPDEEPEERPKKKQKTSKGESDAAMAARLQAEENGRSRPTRGGATRKKAAPVKKTSKKRKSAAKVNSDDDSAEGSGSEAKPKRKPGGAFNAPMQLSAPLSALLGEQQLSRPQTVKRIWEHIKANNLQHENDKRHIRCDEQMRAIFNQDNIHMFSMNKTLSKHLYPLPQAETNGVDIVHSD